MGRDEDIQAIVELGRRTRNPTPRWLWLAAAVVGGICAMFFALVISGVFGEREPPSHLPSQPPSHPVERRPAAGSGLGTGLVIGTGVGIAIGFSIGRQRCSHSSRKSP